MNRKCALRSGVLGSLVVLFSVSSAHAADLFADKNLEAAVRDELKKPAKEALKEADLMDLFILKARDKKIASLVGLEKCTNLQSLVLPKNAIKDVKPIAGLTNLQKLDLADNQISDISPLAKLVRLQYLHLAGNQVVKLDPLKDLKKLTSLYLAKNKVNSLKALSGMEKLSSLDLANNLVKDLSPLKGLKWMSSLNLQNNQIADVSALVGMTDLRYTMLQGNKITDVTPLVNMAKKDASGERRFAPYWYLFLGNNPLSAKAKSAQLPELQKIGVRVSLK